MEQRLIKEVILIEGMTCTNCERKIERALSKLEGIIEVKALYSESRAYITFDAGKIDLQVIIEAIDESGYKAYGSGEKTGLAGVHYAAIGIIILALYVIVKNTIGFNFIPAVDRSMSYGLLFIVGLLTSLHCIAMCGGLNISQCISRSGSSDAAGFGKLKPSLLYNTGRVISYTLIGGAVGALGSVVSFSGKAKGIVAIAAGAFMIIMGLNMLNISPALRKVSFRLIPKSISDRIFNSEKKHGPLYVGLLNGLMPCGPLQTMQLYALGTGSFAAGALSMLAFSLGTVPLMFGLGAISTMLSKRFTKNMMKAGAVLVMVLGFVMIGRGMSLSGISTGIIPKAEASAGNSSVAEIKGGVQTVSIELQRNKYTPIIVQKGIPVQFIINAEKENINGCNNEIYIPEYEKSLRLKPGENIIEFTPDQEGSIPYSCWMGMIRSNILVVPDLAKISNEAYQEAETNTQGGFTMPCCR
ncbi:urease accessory protein UreH domain-containing protein [Lutispora saccharofermentans]|uniref:Sulfite exporter TauE/SafE family protein n=1 Tax=Lutispora saccharofermentans TaxID=3024236 RepID=A0ABT1NEY7_9FIRM|nr:sulfite exporter TauE/SafE family protein [Lutispora saccharofermentans]MCQ1529721.1 sulfite exporter TauE/SafE family protein [Lutispora saccharofermentans]